MLSEAVLVRSPLSESIREARGENFTNDRFHFQYYNASRIRVSFIRVTYTERTRMLSPRCNLVPDQLTPANPCLQPQGGPLSGGSPVQVHGAGFMASGGYDKLKCKFGGQLPSPATFSNAQRVVCVTPKQAHGISLALEITVDGQRYTDDGHNFSFYGVENTSEPNLVASLFVRTVHPMSGPSRGGTIVSLHGGGFLSLCASSQSQPVFHHRELDGASGASDGLHEGMSSRSGLFCIFEGVGQELFGAVPSSETPVLSDMIPATLFSDSLVLCQAPPYEGFALTHVDSTTTDVLVPVEVTINANRSDRTYSAQSFMYYRDDRHFSPKLHSVQPSGGPTDGGYVVRIAGHTLRTLISTGTPTCRFGPGLNATVAATIDSRPSGQVSFVWCIAPPLTVQRRSEIALNVAQNGQDYTRRPLRFLYYELADLVIQKLSPLGGPYDGGTVVTITGKHISQTYGGLLCAFGATFVPAAPSGGGTVSCASPRVLPFLDAYHTVAVRVTINNDTFAASLSSQPFTYFSPAALAVSSIYPQAGPTRGGTLITVTGAGFRDLGGIFCKFGGIISPIRAGVPTTSDSLMLRLGALDPTVFADVLTCVSPPMSRPTEINIEAVRVDLSVTVLPCAHAILITVSVITNTSLSHSGQQ